MSSDCKTKRCKDVSSQIQLEEMLVHLNPKKKEKSHLKNIRVVSKSVLWDLGELTLHLLLRDSFKWTVASYGPVE